MHFDFSIYKSLINLEPLYYLDVLNSSRINQLVFDHNIDTIIHFSALLSAVGEANVPLAIKVNAEGVQNMLEVAKFVFGKIHHFCIEILAKMEIVLA